MTPAARIAIVLCAAAFSLTPVPALSSSSPRSAEDLCLACHADKDLESSTGSRVFVDPGVISGSVHGRAGIDCTGCHADLAGVEDFPHASKLKPVSCAQCHGDEARASLASVHSLSSPRLVARPVLCKDCHSYHNVLSVADERSPLSVLRRPATCAKCHAGAGANYARGRVHDLAAARRSSPAGIVRTLYKVIIAVMTAFFLAYISADLMRSRRGS
jgi:hypothetical protein